MIILYSIVLLLIALSYYVVLKAVNVIHKESEDLRTNTDYLIANNQEKICEMCEYMIIGGCCNSQFYQCEGRHCEEAYEMYFDRSHLEIKEEAEILKKY